MHFDILNRLGVDLEYDRQTGRRRDRQADRKPCSADEPISNMRNIQRVYYAIQSK